MERLLKEPGDHESSKMDLFRLRFHNVFPVSKNWNLDTDRVSAFQTAAGVTSGEWFIADTAPLRTNFAGIVPLLDIKLDDLAPMDHVLDELKLKDRFLSQKARSIPRTQGHVEFKEELTEHFRSKVDIIIRLIPTSKGRQKKRQQLIKQVRNLEVYTTNEFIQEICVSYKRKMVKGPPGNGNVALALEKHILKVYLATKSDLEELLIELVDEIFNYCGLMADNPKHSEMCLHVAISENNHARIAKVFSDKGIPSLEGLKFADIVQGSAEGSKTHQGPSKGKSPDEKRFGLGGPTNDARGSASGSKNLRLLRDIPLAILGLPIGIAIGLGGLVASKRKTHFDGKNAADGWKTGDGKSKMKELQTPIPDKKPSGPKEPNKFNATISKSFLHLEQLACSDDDIAFKGEFVVHQALAQALGRNYNPTMRWTSERWTRANFPFFHGDEERHSAFKFYDASGTFTQHLIAEHYPGAKNWLARPPTYHIDVKSTRGDLHTKFSVSPAQFQRARDFSVMTQQMKGGVDSIPKDVYIFARVYEAEKIEVRLGAKGKNAVKIVLVVDPWEYYHADRLVLKHKERLVASIV